SLSCLREPASLAYHSRDSRRTEYRNMLSPPHLSRHHGEVQMLRRSYVLTSIAFAASVLSSTGALASAQRTFVASYGFAAHTADNCSITQPCRAFSDAISVTADQ